MFGLALRLLGIGKLIRQFIFNNWKLFVGITIIIGAYYYVNHIKHVAYQSGRNDVVAEVQAKMNEQNAENRIFEQKLQTIVDTYGRTAVQEASKRIEKETIQTNTIQTLIKEKPIYTECKVDQAVTNARNAIRELGPTP
jgi:hypothetical protein